MSRLTPRPRTFRGYPRSSGRVGTRNHVVVLPSTPLVNRISQMLQAERPRAVCITHEGGSPDGDPDFLIGVLQRFASNPNVSAAIVVGIGDDDDPLDAVVDGARALDADVRRVALLDAGGLQETLDSVLALVDRAQSAANVEPRRVCPAEYLVLGTECGGSDAYSGITANPVIGACSDELIAAGGSTILAEFTELIGAEHVLQARASTPELAEHVTRAIRDWEDFALEFGEDLTGQNISPGNMRGGITTIEEKSLGCVRKGGTAPVVDLVGFGERSGERGLILMDTDGDDIAELVALASGAANVVVFSTGRGTPVGSPIVPTIKISSNTALAEHMSELIDFDAGVALTGRATLGALGGRLFDRVLSVASGELTSAELRGQRDFALPPTRASA